jgi:protein required for attachment to host cells
MTVVRACPGSEEANMPNTWVVVADSGSARIFGAKSPVEPLEELVDFTHPEALVSGRRLVSDRAGRTTDSHGRSHSFESEDSPREHEARTFARLLGHEICLARARGDFDHLLLVAPPRFLGSLRSSLDAETRKRIDGELASDFVGLSAQEIRARLAENLELTETAH